MAYHPYYSPFRRRMILLIILASLLPIMFLAFAWSSHFRASYSKKTIAHAESLVELHRQSVDIFLRQRLSELQIITDLAGPEMLRDGELLVNLLEVLRARSNGAFVDIGLVASDGRQVAYAGPLPLDGVDYSDAEWFRQAMERQSYISDVFSGLRGSAHFIVADHRIWGGREFVVRSTVDFATFNDLIDDISLGRTGLAYIVDRAGVLQAYARRMEFTPDPQELLEIIGENDEGDARKERAAGIVSTVRKSQATGKETLFVLAPLKDGDWLLVFQQDADDAFAALKTGRILASSGILITALAVWVMAFLLSGRMVRMLQTIDKEKETMNEQVIKAGKLASLGELAAGIGHEINNPVAIMMEEAGWVEDILADGIQSEQDVAEIKRALAQIRTQGRRCRDITHKLLTFARKRDPSHSNVDMNDLVREMVDLSLQRARLANVEIVQDLAENLPSLYVSYSELQQVALNLINNALDAMEEKGGTLTLTTSRRGDNLILTVEDTGHGIPKANLNRIFDPFFTTKPVGKGTGLGLSICYGIIQKMGGKLEVASRVGHGSKFTASLPVRAMRLEEDDEWRIPGETGVNGKRGL